MSQISPIQVPPYQTAPQPSYNAVKIDIHNPQVNAPDAQKSAQAPSQEPVTAPIYSYPQAQVYEMPQQSIYKPEQPEAQKTTPPPAVQEMPSVPPPVIIQPTINQSPVTPVGAPAPIAAPPPEPATNPVQPVEVKAPEVTTPKIDLNEFITKLTSPDYEVQAKAMESIADMSQNSPDKATELLDVKIVDTLLGIMSKDTTKLEGPTPKQLQIREKIMGGKTVTEAETAEANKITPMEQAERNKQYSIYTVAILQKLYGSEIEKMSNTVVPLTELPGAAGIVEQVKNNPNPMVRASGIDALSYIQRPEYKQDLTTLFTVAKKDQDANVQQAATKALEKLAQVADAPIPAATPATTPVPTPAPVVATETSKAEEAPKKA